MTCTIRARMIEIEHDPDEPPRDGTGNWLYWANLAVLVFCAAVYFLNGTPDWASIGLGAYAGIFIATWAIGITGNKVPKWMR